MSADDVAEKIALVEKSIVQLDSINPIEIEAVVDLVSDENLLTPLEVNSAKEDLFGNEELVAEVADLARTFTDLEEQEAFDVASTALVIKDLLLRKLNVLQEFDASAATGIPEYEGTQPYNDYTKST
jgi:hypothetical protein